MMNSLSRDLLIMMFPQPLVWLHREVPEKKEHGTRGVPCSGVRVNSAASINGINAYQRPRKPFFLAGFFLALRAGLRAAFFAAFLLAGFLRVFAAIFFLLRSEVLADYRTRK